MLESRESIKQYLDQCIKYWREKRDNDPDGEYKYSYFYIDAYQSMRKSIFGEILPEKRIEND
jgi:hypothetical protein